MARVLEAGWHDNVRMAHRIRNKSQWSPTIKAHRHYYRLFNTCISYDETVYFLCHFLLSRKMLICNFVLMPCHTLNSVLLHFYCSPDVVGWLHFSRRGTRYSSIMIILPWRMTKSALRHYSRNLRHRFDEPLIFLPDLHLQAITLIARLVPPMQSGLPVYKALGYMRRPDY